MKTSIILPTGSTVTSGDPVVELEHVSFDHGSERVLDEVSLRIGRGDFLGIIGPNGSGKTTLLKVLLGLLRPASGQITLFGSGVRVFREWARIGYVPPKATAIAARFLARVLGAGHTGAPLLLVAPDVSVVAGEVTRLACLNRRLVFHGSPEEAMRSGALAQLYRAESLVVAHHH